MPLRQLSFLFALRRGALSNEEMSGENSVGDLLKLDRWLTMVNDLDHERMIGISVT